jgi:RNA-dependent RNA polymerase
LDGLALGSMVDVSTFVPLSNSAKLSILNCLLSLNVRARRLELLFDLVLPRLPPQEFKITVPLGHISAGSLAVNRSQPSHHLHSIFFDSLIAPQVWKRSQCVDEDDLKDRLYWTEHEQWVRQCEIVQDPSDTSFQQSDTRIIVRHSVLQTGSYSNYTKQLLMGTGRWKAYWLLFRTETAEDEKNLAEFLEMLGVFNIKTTNRPITITSDVSEALGMDIEAELDGLPYNVRYSFDVCLAHSYLYILSITVYLCRNEYTISKKFIDRLKALPAATSCGILDTIAAGRKYIPDPMEYLSTAETTYKGAYRIDSDRDLPAYCKRVQRCLITPTSLMLMSPSIDVTNRVIRHFIRYLNRFLRVTCMYQCVVLIF